ncbi:hypothetical protein [Kribbella sp. CA-293567]|uniref:hypothetical protein n=1 Tax=Kribbella sp. CA-293567 TaxID=3002436 RepID=UPI0022DE4803|nr:hypothetical protein [Kribbella sp. CA-293567]WBQ03307.1 hypothetical protein OX958_25415 [Kribbella sp. CA-293567]
MTHVDDRTGPTRARRSAGRSATRANARALNHGGDSRVAARAGRAVPTKDVSGAQLESEAERAERLAAGRRAASRTGRSARKKTSKSHTAVGAAIVAGAAVVATLAFVLTNGDSAPPQAGGNPPPVVAAPTSAVPVTKSAGANPAPAAASTVRANRKPPAVTNTTQRAAANPPTSAAPNTGKASPVFQRGQWIAVIDKYPTDAGMEADKLAKQLAGKMIAAGVPARAMLLSGQYPGIADSSASPESDAWVVYLGPFATAEAALDLCQAPKTQAAYASLACPIHQPAAAG